MRVWYANFFFISSGDKTSSKSKLTYNLTKIEKKAQKIETNLIYR